MRLLIRLSDRTTDLRFLASLDENQIFLSGGEKPVDVVLGALARTDRRTHEASRPHTHLVALQRDGIECPRALVLPGALQVRRAPRGFTPSGLAQISMDLDRQSIILPDESLIDLPSFLGCPEDRWFTKSDAPYSSGDHPYAFRIHRPLDPPSPAEFEAGSLTSGVLSTFLPGPYGLYSEDLAILAGIMASQAGLFQQDGWRACRAGAMDMREARRNFLSEGHIASSRFWMPEQHLPGGTFADCRKAADPDIFDLGRRFGQVMKGSEAGAVRRAVEAALASLGEDVSQYHLSQDIWPTLSNHGRIAVEALIRDLHKVIEQAS